MSGLNPPTPPLPMGVVYVRDMHAYQQKAGEIGGTVYVDVWTPAELRAVADHMEWLNAQAQVARGDLTAAQVEAIRKLSAGAALSKSMGPDRFTEFLRDAFAAAKVAQVTAPAPVVR